MPSANTSATSVLKKASIFSGLNEQEFAFLAARAVQRGFSAGKLIFSEGEPCTELYVVQAGTGGREQARSTVRLGGSVADLPVFDGNNYPASAPAITDCSLLFLSKKDS